MMTIDNILRRLMKQSVFGKFILPFIQWYALMILIAIAIDYFLHRYNMVEIGRYFGFIGTLLIVISFVYSMRKRKILKEGSPKIFLIIHEYTAWIGSILILVHAGIHFNSVLPWLAIFMLLINVASGLVGKYLLKKANESLKEKKRELINSGLTKEDVENNVFWDSITVDLMKKWRAVHFPIALLLGIFSFLHILTIIIYGK